MRCPYCSHTDTKVVETREAGDSEITRRRRECLACQKRFTTYERIEGIDIIVIKKDETRERFDRAKLASGIIKACEKRPVSAETIEKLLDEIETALRHRATTEVPSTAIGEMVMDRLKGIDEVAYVRFASVYREFTDARQFVDELAAFVKKKRRR